MQTHQRQPIQITRIRPAKAKIPQVSTHTPNPSIPSLQKKKGKEENSPLLRRILKPTPLIPILRPHHMRCPPRPYIILLHHHPIPIRKRPRQHPHPLITHPLRLLHIAIPPQPIPRQHLMRRPAIREIPLFLRTLCRDGSAAALTAGTESAALFEFRQCGGDEQGGLVRGSEARPEWPEGCDGLVGMLGFGDGVVVEVEACGFVPAVFVDAGFSETGAPVPDRGGFEVVGLLAWGAEGSGDEEGVAEDGADAGCDVGFVAVEEGVEVDGGEVGADAFEAVGGVVAGFADGAVMEEECVEVGFVDLVGVVGGFEVVQSHFVFFGVGFEDVGEVAGLAFWWDTLACGTVSGETGFRVEPGLGHPPVVVLFHGCEDGLSEKVLGVRFEFRGFVYSDREICQEGRLCSAKIVGPIGVEDLAIMLDLEDEIPEDRLDQLQMTVNHTDSTEAAIPIIQLIEAISRDNEGDCSRFFIFRGFVIAGDIHLESQYSRLIVDTSNEIPRELAFRQPLHVKIHGWVILCNFAIINILLWRSRRNVDPWLRADSLIIESRSLDATRIHLPCKLVPPF